MDDWDAWERGQTSPLIADEMLRLRIAESVAWCESLATLADCRPSRFPQNLLHDGPDDLVCSIGRERQLAWQRRKLSTANEARVVVPGRFMRHFPDENLTDGAAEIGSEGFFDAWNLPPIDTWVSFFFDEPSGHTSQRYLLCYVPSWAVARADAGIEWNPEDCIGWLDRSDVTILARVEALTRRSWTRHRSGDDNSGFFQPTPLVEQRSKGNTPSGNRLARTIVLSEHSVDATVDEKPRRGVRPEE